MRRTVRPCSNFSALLDMTFPASFWILKKGEEDMKVRIKFIGMSELLPDFKDKKEVQVDFAGNTVKDLLSHLSSRLERKKKNWFLSDQGEFSQGLVMLINERMISGSNLLTQELREDDLIEFIPAPG